MLHNVEGGKLDRHSQVSTDTLCLEYDPGGERKHTFFNAVFCGTFVVGVLTGGRDTLDTLIVVMLVARTLGGAGTI